jgi:hypothetical protein
MFHGFLRQRFHLKNVQFFVLLCSLFSLQADVDKKSRMQIIAQSAQRYHVQKITIGQKKVDRSDHVCSRLDNPIQHTSFSLINRSNNFFNRKKLSKNITDVTILSQDRLRKLSSSMAHLQEKFRRHLQEKFGDDQDIQPLFLTDGLFFEGQSDEHDTKCTDKDLFDQNHASILAGLAGIFGLSSGAAATGGTAAITGATACGGVIATAIAPYAAPILAVACTGAMLYKIHQGQSSDPNKINNTEITESSKAARAMPEVRKVTWGSDVATNKIEQAVATNMQQHQSNSSTTFSLPASSVAVQDTGKVENHADVARSEKPEQTVAKGTTVFVHQPLKSDVTTVQSPEQEKRQAVLDKARYDAIVKHNAQVEKYEKELAKLDDKFDKIAGKLDKKGIGSHEHLLPTTGGNIKFQGAHTKDGKLLRDETGAYPDLEGRKWLFDQKKGKFQVTDLKGNRLFVQQNQTVQIPTSAQGVSGSLPVSSSSTAASQAPVATQVPTVSHAPVPNEPTKVPDSQTTASVNNVSEQKTPVSLPASSASSVASKSPVASSSSTVPQVSVSNKPTKKSDAPTKPSAKSPSAGEGLKSLGGLVAGATGLQEGVAGATHLTKLQAGKLAINTVLKKKVALAAGKTATSTVTSAASTGTGFFGGAVDAFNTFGPYALIGVAVVGTVYAGYKIVQYCNSPAETVEPKGALQMSVPEPLEKPEKQGCGDWQNVDNGVKTLTTPKVEPVGTKTTGCGHKPDVVVSTNTAHGPVHDFTADHKPGCGGLQIPTQEEIAAGLTLHMKKEGDLSDVDVTFSNNPNHIFNNNPGHVPDSPEIRNLIESMVKDVDNFLVTDKRNKLWFAKILKDGTQAWAEVRDGVIRNCGINKVPREANNETGLSAFKAPGNNNTK